MIIMTHMTPIEHNQLNLLFAPEHNSTGHSLCVQVAVSQERWGLLEFF